MLQAEPGSEFNRADAAGLVEAIAIAIVDQGQHAGSRCAIGTAHQRLVREQPARAQVDDGLERHGEGETQCRRIAAFDAS
ncbi:MAG: hypothetical protein IPO66_02225 [Rhodanobacteraceae bacterium]|nr:hypothetical protein [Rhodanobacteraceae bacterium]